jgi:membrane protein YqaA with SNARE-associated domain
MRAGVIGKLWIWTLSLAARKSAELWLAIVAFIESSVFLVPADVLFLPMSIARPERSYRYALIATVASVAGGIAGWCIGFFAYEAIAKPILALYGKLDGFDAMLATIDQWWILLLLITSGLAHLPPIKIVTILAGVMHMNLPLFVLLATLARGARFFAIGFLLVRYGEKVREFIDRRLSQIVAAIAFGTLAVYGWISLAQSG